MANLNWVVQNSLTEEVYTYVKIQKNLPGSGSANAKALRWGGVYH